MIEALATTIRQVFPSIYVMDLPRSFNSILYATRQPTQAANLAANVLYLTGRGDTHPLLIYAAQLSLVALQPDPPQTIVFTDDRAPVEWITNQMVIDFVLSGETELLQ